LNVRLPLIVIVPIEFPGARMPPLATVTAPITVPVPPSVEPELTVIDEISVPFNVSEP
jgi:hypothetical protein